MTATTTKLDEAVAKYDREMARAALERSEQQRSELLRRFPLERWPEMSLEEYARGQEDAEESFCLWMEFRSMDLGSIRGGSARKLVIYERKDQQGWYFPNEFENERVAWERLRADFLQAFEYARNQEWQRIDELEVLSNCPALRLKTLHLYFRDDVLPVYSNPHMRHYLRRLGRPDEEGSGYAVV